MFSEKKGEVFCCQNIIRGLQITDSLKKYWILYRLVFGYTDQQSFYPEVAIIKSK